MVPPPPPLAPPPVPPPGAPLPSAELLDLLPDGVLAATDGVVGFASSRAGELLAATPERLHGAALAALFGDRAAEAFARLTPGATCTVRDLAVRRPGATSPLDANARLDGGWTLLTLRPTDGGSEAVFRRRIGWLEKLAAGMAHEIRNPLGGIRGAAQLLRREGADGELVDLMVGDADLIEVQVARLMQLCRPRPLSAEVVDVNRLLAEELARPAARRDGVRVELDLDPSLPFIQADPARLREAFGNLLRNAFEAAEAAVTVRTRVDHGGLHAAGTGRGTTLRVEIEDDGPGLPPERLETLFAPYDTTKPGGTGLGLFVARLAVEDHGGLVQVDGRPGRGARFRVLLARELPVHTRDEAPGWAQP